MEQSTQEYVILQLKQYPMLCRQIELLEFELQNQAGVQPEEMIEALALNRDPDRTDGYHTTPDIAMHYRAITEKLNTERLRDISAQYLKTVSKRQRIQQYVRLLPEKQRLVIEYYYFDNLTWRQISEKMGLAIRTAFKLRQSAVENLAQSYDFVASWFGKDI